mmetsp:Transcript_6553/g.14158  ORF Transcript_6553/g.14158 Transcript_6553/m.14158 type:complete len:96 (-) Transcript_6553:108-395(-)
MISYANSGNVSFDHAINVSTSMDGNVEGTNKPPSGAYPEQIACSKENSWSPSRVDLYFMPLRPCMSNKWWRVELDVAKLETKLPIFTIFLSTVEA